MGHQYADEVHRILNNEFYRKGVSPAQLFELDTPSFSMRWWDRWFRWAFVTYYLDDDFNDDGDRGSLLYGLEKVERSGTFPEWRRYHIFAAFKEKLKLKTVEEVEYVRQDPIKTRVTAGMYFPEYNIVVNGEQYTVCNYAYQSAEPAESDLCLIQVKNNRQVHRESCCLKYDNHEGEWLGFQKDE